MAHTGQSSNGASLEDCHTNFFALADLNGIKWKRLTSSSSATLAPLEDAILSSYAKCLSQGLLCVWRRVAKSEHAAFLTEPAPAGLPGQLAKELWIFWCGDEPDTTNLVAPQLTDLEHGSWEAGLSYEQRNLLFKALHNLVQKCLLQQGFIRLGRWFLQPSEWPTNMSRSSYREQKQNNSQSARSSTSLQITFAFNFFVHGDATVCVGVDVRQHPPIYRLTRQHLIAAQQQNGGNCKVILCPYGLQGTLTGASSKEADASTLLNEWRQFFPLPRESQNNHNTNENCPPNTAADTTLNEAQQSTTAGQVPVAVQVQVGNVRMKYPSAYVFVTETDELAAQAQQQNQLQSPSAASSAHKPFLRNNQQPRSILSAALASKEKAEQIDPNDRTALPRVALKTSLEENRNPGAPAAAMPTDRVSSRLIKNKTWVDTTSLPIPMNGQADDNVWQLKDVMCSQATCCCFRCVQQGRRDDRRKDGSSKLPSLKPGAAGNFHKRRSYQEVPPAIDSILLTKLSLMNGPPNPDPSDKMGPPSAQLPIPSVEPLSIPASMPPSVDQSLGDRAMDEGGAPHLSHIKQEILTSAPSSVIAADCNTPLAQDKILEQRDQVVPSSIAAHQMPKKAIGLKRPTLPWITHEEDLTTATNAESALYNYSDVSTALVWDAPPPPKRTFPLRVRSPVPPECAGMPGRIDENQGYAGHRRDRDTLTYDQTIEENVFGVVSPSDVTSAALTPMSSGPHSNNPPTPRQQHYHQAHNAFTKIEDMRVTEADLDHIFDTSSHASQDSPQDLNMDGLFHAPNGKVGTPQHGSTEDLHRKSMELSTMYPTPPSQEPNAEPSPCNIVIGSPATVLTHFDGGEQPQGASDIERYEWTIVHRPSMINKLVSSLIYAPISPLPSSLQPQINVPTDCVYKVSWQNRPNGLARQKQSTSNNQTSNQIPGPASMGPSSQSQRRSLQQEMNRPPVAPPPIAQRGWPVDMGRPAPPYPLGSPGYGNNLMSPAGSMLTPGGGPLHHSFGASRPSSVDPYHAASGPPSVVREQSHPEISSLLVNLFLSDTVLDLFRDHNFTSCTICVCNMNIKGGDVPLYLPCQVLSGPALVGYDDAQYKCTCGFSALVNRHLSHQAGLFYEDEVEITGIPYEAPPSKIKFGQHQSQEQAMYAEKKLLEYVQSQCLGMVESPCSLLANVMKSADETASNTREPPPLNAQSAKIYRRDSPLQSVQLMADSCTVAAMAIEAALVGGPAALTQPTTQWYGRQSMDDAAKEKILHRWSFLQVATPPNHSTIIKLLRSLQPILQEGVHNQRRAQKGPSQNMWEVTYRVSGPMTWRQFHRMAGRGTEDQCEPQPIPSLLVGYDRDWLSLSPFALKYWDKLLLEPYAAPRDVAYIVVCPDSDAPLPHIKAFFRELSCVYESANLGRHCALSKSFQDGILKVGRGALERKMATEDAASAAAPSQADEWFTEVLNRMAGADEPKKRHLAARLKLYAQICRYHLAPHLATQQLDKTILDPPPQQVPKLNHPTASPRAPATPDNPASVGSLDKSMIGTPTKDDGQDNSMGSQDHCATGPHDNCSPQSAMQALHSGLNVEESSEPNNTPMIVVYLVDPFTYHNNADGDMLRTSMTALHHCYQLMFSTLPEQIRNNVQLQIVPLESVLGVEQCCNPSKKHDQLMQMALSLYYQSGPTLPEVIPPGQVKSLTSMGPAATQDIFIKQKLQNSTPGNSTNTANGPGNSTPLQNDVKTWNSPFILAPLKDKQNVIGDSGVDHQERSSILYCSYCISEDQRWLLASVSNERGDLLRNASINIEIPNRTRRKKASARLVGLNKLMEFILKLISNNTITPWRLVIGRLGRIGHGELKEWNQLLSRKSLLRFSRYLRETCQQCEFFRSPLDVPCIVSACLVSLEADSCLQVFSDQFSPDDKITTNAQRCELSTPQDATSTHILVFPTSATIQSNQANYHQLQDPTIDLEEDELFSTITQDIEGNGNFDDLCNWNVELDGSDEQDAGVNDEANGGRCERPNNDHLMADIMMGGPSGGMLNGPSSGMGMGVGNQMTMGVANHNSRGGHGEFLLGGEEAMQLLQQPLALGYYVSTAPAAHLPKWFWSSCPHLENSNPVFLKSALLLHTPMIHPTHDDMLHGNQRNGHQLDSNLTTDVLRYVLEGYNALSWLQLSPSTHDRSSCLPVHVQNLLRLYHAVDALI